MANFYACVKCGQLENYLSYCINARVFCRPERAFNTFERILPIWSHGSRNTFFGFPSIFLSKLWCIAPSMLFDRINFVPWLELESPILNVLRPLYSHNTNLLWKEKYHCTSYNLFHWLGFKQTCSISVVNLKRGKGTQIKTVQQEVSPTAILSLTN